ncbi:hypothetical protein CLV80_10323 [Yoonia maritima]|uniref:Uncharacterized protein n=1 Tax=Yoonia maritima TaxID=1435347 RepID=A0A2T0W115_9RHOB|nr:hypothetical protein [Yoonia maritima]PRY78701.1 hypothetical protein CLV80_10323 [Yoonia maritima]
MLKLIPAVTYVAAIFVVVSPFGQSQAEDTNQISLGHLKTDTFDGGYLFGNFNLSVGERAWGAELGMFGVVGRLHETYASATWTQNGHKIELGFPRPAYDRFAVSGLTQLMPRLALFSISTTRSRATDGVMTESEFLPYGAVYSDHVRDLSISVHGVPDTDITIYGIGTSVASGQWDVDLAAEAVSENSAWDWNAKTQLRYDAGPARLGLGLYAAEANDAGHTAEMFAEFDIHDDTELTALLRQTEGTDPAIGLGVAYAFDLGISTDFIMVHAADEGLAVAAAVSYGF